MNISERIDRFFDFIWKFSFNADEFRWKQQWYQKNVVRRWAYIHEDIWTSTRYLAYPIFKLLWTINPWLALFVSIYVIGASDYIDGEVARYREKERKRLGINISGGKWYLWIRKNFGHINDGFADRCMAVLTIDFLASSYVHSYAITALYVVEFGGYPLVCILEKIGIVKADYFHSWTGKTKFNLEIVLITFLVVAEKLFPGWIFIPLWTSVFLGVVYLFAVFSIGCKINPMFLCFLPHAITAGSVVAAGWGVYEAVAHKNFYLAAPLMMISAICDVLDGLIARKIREIFKAKKTNFGVLADDTADWLNYALGLAIILFMASINFFVCLFYVLCTTVRLIYFYRQSKKEGEKKEGKSRAIFNGIPSTGVAFFIASLIFWKDSMINYPLLLTGIVIACAMGEVWFKKKWYHFNNIVGLPMTMLLSMLAFLIFAGCLSRFGEGSSFLFLLYLVLFYKKVADKIWHLDEKEKVRLRLIPKNQ